MAQHYIKVGVTGAVLAMTFGFLFLSTLREGTEYFVKVQEVAPDRAAWRGRPIQLQGYVVPGSIRWKPGSLEYQFRIQNDPPRALQSESRDLIEVSYTGVVPDTFKAEADVVLRGQFTATGFEVVPNGIVAKCPSKYEAVARSTSTGS